MSYCEPHILQVILGMFVLNSKFSMSCSACVFETHITNAMSFLPYPECYILHAICRLLCSGCHVLNDISCKSSSTSHIHHSDSGCRILNGIFVMAHSECHTLGSISSMSHSECRMQNVAFRQNESRHTRFREKRTHRKTQFRGFAHPPADLFRCKGAI